jgi:antitoxin YqcF
MEDKIPTTLPEHYECELGQIVRGWSDNRETHGIQVVSFNSQPEPHVTTFATLGLSKHIFGKSSDRQIRQEILISANDNFSPDKVAGLLLSIAEMVLKRETVLLRGEVIGPASPIIEGSRLDAIYVTNPSPFRNTLVNFSSALPSTIFAYLVPITSIEASQILVKGWRWFEHELEAENPDIWNLHR